MRVGQEKTYAISGIEKGKNQNGGPAVLNVKVRTWLEYPSLLELSNENIRLADTDDSNQESFDMGDKSDPLWDNRYPSEAALPEFRNFMDDFYATCHSTYTLILRAIERGFALKGLSVSIVDSGVNSSELRLNYYPTVDVRSVRGGTHTRISEHTDFGMVTLLFQDSVGGLEVADHVNEGQFISVEPESKTEILANVGDSLERLTNGYLKSISHRVTVPKSLMDAEDGLLRERYSFAYFGKAERERSLKPLGAFVDEDGGRPAKWGDVTAHEWNQIKLGLSYG